MPLSPLVTVAYQADDTKVHPIRVHPETYDATLNPPGTAITESTFFKSSSSKRRYGNHARHITLAIRVGTNGAFSVARVYARIPILTKAIYDAIKINDTYVYQTKTWQVISKSPEVVK